MLMSTCRMLRAAFSSRWTAAPPPKEYGRAPTYICLRYTRIFDWLPKALATFCKDICRLKYTSAHNLTKEPPSPPQWPAWISGLFEKLDFFTEYFGTSRCSRMGSYGSLLHGGRIDRGRFQSPSPSPFAVVSQPHHTHAPRTDFKEAMDGDVSIAHEHHHLYADMVMEDGRMMPNKAECDCGGRCVSLRHGHLCSTNQQTAPNSAMAAAPQAASMAATVQE
jgi:hypothetical protein